LDKLKIYPFEYKMIVEKVLQDGGLFKADVLDISLADVIAKFKKGANVQAALSLGAGYSTQLSAPHTLLGGFKNLVAASQACGYSFP
jgi:large subunit ribosomal protein LP0